MIRLISENPDSLLKEFIEKGDPISAWIKGILEEERSMGRTCDIWVYFQGEKPVVLFTKLGDTVAISEIPFENTQYEEVVAFLEIMIEDSGEIWGIGGSKQAVHQIWNQLQKKGFILEREKGGKTMEYKNNIPTFSEKNLFKTAEILDYEQLYSILSASNMSSVAEAESKDCWHVNLSHNLRHGFIKVAVIEKDGKYVSVGMLEENCEGIAFVSSITTLSDYRKKGFAAEIVKALTAESLRDERRPLLFAVGEDSARLYQSLGYEEIGSWYDIHYTRSDKNKENDFGENTIF